MTADGLDARRFAPATERNREPILRVLQRAFPAEGRVLEVASGTGEHAAFFARHLEGVQWLATEREPSALASIRAWAEEAGLANLEPPQILDVHGAWPKGPFDAALCCNMIHISPWSATQALLQGMGRVLVAGGILVTYGPYRIGGRHTADSNARFEQWLLEQDPRFGVRDIAEVEEAATDAGLRLTERVEMPANNFCLVFAKD